MSFSKRETQVLELISEGHTNQQIVDKLFTSRRTVEWHRQALMDKACEQFGGVSEVRFSS